ncbi:MAG: FGGY family carbohydrate kinase [Acidimicrobiia bacterium]
MNGRLLVIDVGTSNVRVSVVAADASIVTTRLEANLPQTPFPGLVEFDAVTLAELVEQMAAACLEQAGPVDAVGITNQRSSTVVWDRSTGLPIAPGLGWQDLRTVLECLTLAGDGYRVAPNQSATKLAWLLDNHDADRARDLCFGTIDSWLIWRLTRGAVHATDATNAGVTGLIELDGSGWWTALLERLRIPVSAMPTIVDSSGVIGEAVALPGAPVIAGVAGDQQASLVGQGCLRPGQAKATFGTGAFLNVWVGATRPSFPVRGDHGCFPIIATRTNGTIAWGVEALMLTAGSNVEWLRDDMALIESAAASHEIAARCTDTGGVMYVPALLGLGTPHFDYGARGTLLGLTRGSGRPEIVRAVLEGVAHRAADLLESAEADTGLSVGTVHVDGGMSANPTFVQAVADATQRKIEVCPLAEATTLGAAFLAGVAVGVWPSLDATAQTWSPAATYTPERTLDRDQWHVAVERSRRWIPDLSALDF